MKILKKGDDAIKAYQNSERGKKNAENERYRVPVGTFKLGEFTEVEEDMNGRKQIYYVYPLLRDNIVVGNVTPAQIEKTALYSFEQSLKKKRNAEKYYLIPMPLRPMLEIDKVSLAGKTVTISVATESAFSVEFKSDGYKDDEEAMEAWKARKAKNIYNVDIS